MYPQTARIVSHISQVPLRSLFECNRGAPLLFPPKRGLPEISIEGLDGTDPIPRPGFNVLFEASGPGMIGEGKVLDAEDFRGGVRTAGSYGGKRTASCMKCEDSRKDRRARAYDGTWALSIGGGRMTDERPRYDAYASSCLRAY